MFCAPSQTRLPRNRSAAPASAINGGQRTTSARPIAASRGNNASISALLSTMPLFIFQFPATKGTRFTYGLILAMMLGPDVAGAGLSRNDVYYLLIVM